MAGWGTSVCVTVSWWLHLEHLPHGGHARSISTSVLNTLSRWDSKTKEHKGNNAALSLVVSVFLCPHIEFVCYKYIRIGGYPYQSVQFIPIGYPVGKNWIELVLSWCEILVWFILE